MLLAYTRVDLLEATADGVPSVDEELDSGEMGEPCASGARKAAETETNCPGIIGVVLWWDSETKVMSVSLRCLRDEF